MSTSARIVYDVATNFDPALIEAVHRHNESGVFSSVVGGRHSALCNGGQPSHASTAEPLDELSGHVRLCHERGLRFNYLLDRVCSANQEVFPKDHQAILKSVDEIVGCGVDGVTVNSPLLCAVIRKRHPSLEIRVGSQSNIATCKHVLQWKAAGADALTLGGRLTRNFALFRVVVGLAKQLNLKLRMNANDACLPDCVYMNAHISALAHSGELKQKGCALFLDYNLLQCTYDRLSSPSRLMGSSWIRPEDVRYYEDVCTEAGFEGFGLVLLDGGKSTSFLSRAIAAYASRSFDGNLLDLLCLPREEGPRSPVKSDDPAVKGDFSGRDISQIESFFRLPDVRIDNKLLDGFIRPFVEGFLCGEKVCADGRGANPVDELVCDHCNAWVAKAVSPIGADAVRWNADAQALLESIRSSRVFGAE
jgi:hypothetical protein